MTESKRVKMAAWNVGHARNGSLCISGFEHGRIAGPMAVVWFSIAHLDPEDRLDFIEPVEQWCRSQRALADAAADEAAQLHLDM